MNLMKKITKQNQYDLKGGIKLKKLSILSLCCIVAILYVIGSSALATAADTIGPVSSGLAATPNPTQGAPTVLLIATVDDTATGGSNVIAAQYRVDGGSWKTMSALDGVWNSKVEGVRATVNSSVLAVGNHDLQVRGKDSKNRWGAVSARYALRVTPVDVTGPVSSNVVATPNPTLGAETVTITAKVDDTTTGGSTIKSAIYRIDDGDWLPMTADLAPFDSISEDVTAAGVDVSELSVGVHTIEVKGTDYYNNSPLTGSKIDLTISDVTGPVSTMVAATPDPTDAASSVTITATVDDTGTGGSTIAGADYRIDSGDWTAMAAVDALFDSVSEDVTAVADISGLPVGDYDIEVRGTDSAGNVGEPSDPFTLHVTFAPITFWKDYNGQEPGGYMPDIDQKQDFDNKVLSPGLKLDLDSDPVETQEGWTSVPVIAYTEGYGWDNIQDILSRNRTTGTNLGRDFHGSTLDRTFKIDLLAGEYTVNVYFGDMVAARDMIDVSAEGVLKIDDVSSLAGEVKEETFNVEVIDGTLDLLFQDNGGMDDLWVVNGIEIIPVPADERYCAPVAEANSLWWLDKAHRLEIFDNPEAGEGYFVDLQHPLGLDLNNDQKSDILDLVQDLAMYMGTNVNQPGTLVEDEQDGVEAFLVAHGLRAKLYEHTEWSPEFSYIVNELFVSQDVKLDLGFWRADEVSQDPQTGEWSVTWTRIGGHAVTAAGVNSERSLLAISDPYFDAAEGGAAGVVRSELGSHLLQPHPEDPTVHNVEANASHDVYQIMPSLSPGGKWALAGYPVSLPLIPEFYENNGPVEVVTMDYGQTQPDVELDMICTEIEAAVIVSPSVPPTQTGIEPGSGENTGIVSVVVSGTNFQSGAQVVLTMDGEENIEGDETEVTSTTINCDFDLTGATEGGWNVVVTNPDGKVCTEPVLFNVTLRPVSLTRYEQTDPSVVRTGTWGTYNNTNCSGGSQSYTKTASSYATFTFTGTSVKWIIAKSNNYGVAKVYIDDAPITDGDTVLPGDTGSDKSGVDLYSATSKWQQVAYTKTGLSSGVHTIKIEETSVKNDLSSNYYIGVDAFEATGILVINRIEQTDPSVVHTGTWGTYSNANCSGGSQSYTNTASSYATFTFTGTSVKWIIAKSNNYGVAKVYIDDAPITDGDTVLPGDAGSDKSGVDLYSATSKWQQVAYTKTGLSSGVHTIKIEETSVKNDLSSNYYIGVDAFEVF